MTPERKDYLAKCGYKEKWLRALLRDYKDSIKKAKLKLENGVFDISGQVAVCKASMRANRWLIAILRHELQRLKGIDRVVVPKGTQCKCGCWLCFGWEYCSYCGRRILWEKVK